MENKRKKWGPYVSDRQWGTVREDYTSEGEAWDAVTHDMARSKTYRWGEEGIGGISDDQQTFCLALALWNGKDPILKERYFGLTGKQGNHAEDVKELYYYLDNTPDHTYQKMLYKYPVNEYPYQQLLQENGRRGLDDPEYEITDTGIFSNNGYFDIFTEYAKAADEDILIRYTIHNRSNAPASLHLLPTLWFRNTWAWGGGEKPVITQVDANTLHLQSVALGDYYCYTEDQVPFLFTENETANDRLYGSPDNSPFTKDGINNFVVNGQPGAVNPDATGTKVSPHYTLEVPGNGSVTVRLRLANKEVDSPFNGFDTTFSEQIKEADEFYAKLQEGVTGAEIQLQRQAWAGMLWSKQFFYFNVAQWREGDPSMPNSSDRMKHTRNQEWAHLRAADIISMPDKWEYPWFAAWDLAFHCIAFAAIDPAFAKEQLLLLTEDRYMHPNGQLPAYEWDFSDANPPVHAIAAWKVYITEKERNGGKGDTKFLQRMLHKLMLNFTWWSNRKDTEGNNIFEGGFLGLDNIGLFDRSTDIPGGGALGQSDGTSWMAMYALNLTKIAVELSWENDVYEDIAIKFAQHFFYIAGSMANMGEEEGRGLWDEEDGFYYDMLSLANHDKVHLKFRTLVGLVPLFACQVINEKDWSHLDKMTRVLADFFKARPDLAALVSNWSDTNGNNTHLLSLLRGHRMKRLLYRMLDEKEFLSPHGIRSTSRVYKDNPYELHLDGHHYSLEYAPAESEIEMFGGNSNWRGPVWIPLNYLIIDSLYKFHSYYGDDFKVEYPTGSGNYFNIREIADSLVVRIKSMFLPDENGNRAIYGQDEIFQRDPFFRDHLLFHEYFDGDTGKGLGASHQTGWTGLIAVLGKI
ncbi:MAG: glucosidase [Chitinophagaceae bacterium]|nr:MAG: glucosidase [Chitinophagaceae bacterium]